MVEYPKVEIHYTPPSHVLKIVDDAKEFSESDFSEDEPIYVLKDGKRGTFIKNKDDKYLLAKTVKEKERKKRLKLHERKQKEQNEDLIKEIHYINYEADEENDDEDDESEDEKEAKQQNGGERYDENGNRITSRRTSQDVIMEFEYETETESESDSELESELEKFNSNGEEIEKPPKPPKMPKRRKKVTRKPSPVYIHYEDEDRGSKRTHSVKTETAAAADAEIKINEETQELTVNKETASPEIERVESTEPEPVFGKPSVRNMLRGSSSEEEEESSSKELVEEDKQKLKVPESEPEEELSNLRPESVNNPYFDAKKVQDSDSDLDEFGRMKDRQRPSSAMFDFLPPLKPDPRLDGGDITNCKNRLSRHVVIIREALARNERTY